MKIIAIVIIALLFSIENLAQQPWTYRAAFQPIVPISKKQAIGGYLNFNYTTQINAGNVSMALPTFQQVLHNRFSYTAYLLASMDLVKSGKNKIELRMVNGVRYDFTANKRLKLAGWLRVENRFKDVTGKYDYATRGRLRAYFDYAFGPMPRRPKSWFMQFDIEPQYTFDKQYFSSLLTRFALSFIPAEGSNIELRYFYDLSAAAPGKSFEHTGNQLRLQLIKTFMLKKKNIQNHENTLHDID